jgi:hypothetical protein
VVTKLPLNASQAVLCAAHPGLQLRKSAGSGSSATGIARDPALQQRQNLAEQREQFAHLPEQSKPHSGLPLPFRCQYWLFFGHGMLKAYCLSAAKGWF